MNKNIVFHAGQYHYSNCPFLLIDEGVCNCPEDLKSNKLKEELTDIVGKVADYYINKSGLMVTDAVIEIEKFIKENYIPREDVEGLKMEEYEGNLDLEKGFNIAVKELNKNINNLLEGVLKK